MNPYQNSIISRNRLLSLWSKSDRISLSFLSLFILPFLSNCDQSSSSHKVVIGISQIIEHKALDEARQGIEDVLFKEFGEKKIQILYRNAQGNIATSKQIAQNLIEQNPAVLIGISTPSAQTLKTSLKSRSIPLVFTCVTDPVSAGLVKGISSPAPGITGVIDTPPLEKQIEMMQKIKPDLKKVGVMYNSGEPNSVTTIQRFKEICQRKYIEVIEVVVTKSSEIMTSARHLLPKVQALYIPQDNILVSAMTSLAKISYELKVPIFASDSGSVKEGALASLSYSYYEIGVETGKKVVQILKGKKAETLPIKPPAKVSFYKNDKAAQELGVHLPSLSFSF